VIRANPNGRKEELSFTTVIYIMVEKFTGERNYKFILINHLVFLPGSFETKNVLRWWEIK
jgi:hypothetical protein